MLQPGFGAAATLRSYGFDPKPGTLSVRPGRRFPRAHREYLLGLPHVLGLTVGGEDYWLIHAGLPPVRADPPTEMTEWMALFGTQLLWTLAPLRDRPRADRTVVMGHMAQREVLDLGHLIAIDTGAGLWEHGRLSGLLLPERRVIAS